MHRTLDQIALSLEKDEGLRGVADEIRLHADEIRDTIRYTKEKLVDVERRMAKNEPVYDTYYGGIVMRLQCRVSDITPKQEAVRKIKRYMDHELTGATMMARTRLEEMINELAGM